MDNRRLLLHGCSVGGQFALEYTLAAPDRILGAVVMAGLELDVPPREAWRVPFVFFWGEFDPYYDPDNRAVVESMQEKMDFIELYLDAGQAHVCDSALALETIRALLAGQSGNRE